MCHCFCYIWQYCCFWIHLNRNLICVSFCGWLGDKHVLLVPVCVCVCVCVCVWRTWTAFFFLFSFFLSMKMCISVCHGLKQVVLKWVIHRHACTHTQPYTHIYPRMHAHTQNQRELQLRPFVFMQALNSVSHEWTVTKAVLFHSLFLGPVPPVHQS